VHFVFLWVVSPTIRSESSNRQPLSGADVHRGRCACPALGRLSLEARGTFQSLPRHPRNGRS